MQTVEASVAAHRLNVDLETLSGHKYFTTNGNAHCPQRFWGYGAYTEEEMTPRLKRILERDGVIIKLIEY